MQNRFQIMGGFAVVLASALVAHAVEQSSWGQVKKAFEENAPVAGKVVVVPPGKGTVKPFELAVEALQDVNKGTDVTVTTKVIAAGFSAPTLSKHIQLKSFDSNNELRWTKNQMNVTLIPSGASSSAGFQYNDLTRNQPFQVQEQVQNAQTGNTEVLNGKGIVRLRPDVSVGNVSAPAQAHIGQIVNIVASIGELRDGFLCLLRAAGLIWLPAMHGAEDPDRWKATPPSSVGGRRQGHVVPGAHRCCSERQVLVNGLRQDALAAALQEEGYADGAYVCGREGQIHRQALPHRVCRAQAVLVRATNSADGGAAEVGGADDLPP